MVSGQRSIVCQHQVRPLEEHRSYEFHYPLELGVVLKGHMRWLFSTGEVTLGPGQVWFCGMWEPHGYEIARHPCERLVVIVHPRVLAGSQFEELPGHNWLLPFTVPPPVRPQTTADLQPELHDLVQRFLRANEDTSRQQPVRLRLLLFELLLLVTRHWQPPAELPMRPPGDFDRVKQAIDLVFSSRQRINTAQAAKLCGLSRNRFSLMFEHVTGVTFADFALRYRLNGAARQLLCTDDPLKAVARDWGFNDESHLCRAFTLHYGRSPSQYRRQVDTTEPAKPEFDPE